MTLAESELVRRVEELERVVARLLDERDRERPGRPVPETECPYYTERCLDRMTR